MSLRFRLNLVIALSVLLIVGVGTIFTIYNARQSVRKEVISSVNLASRSVEAGLSDPLSAEDPVAYWRSRMAVPEKTRHLRVRIIFAGGESIDLSGAPTPKSVESAPAWFNWWIWPEPLSKTRIIKTREGSISIVIRDDPNDEIAEAWGEARALFGLILLQALSVSVLVHIVLGRALRSVPVILKGLESIETGNFRERLPDFTVPEFSRISDAFNHAASALEKACMENRALACRALTVQEEERRTLARELHDELGQSLTGIKVTATSITKENPNSQSALESIVSICDHLFSVVRSMMRRLRPTMLDELGLAASLEDLIGNWREQNRDAKVRLHFEDAIETCDDNVKIHLFRIVQESLNNVARHARASKVEVRLEVTNSKHAGNIWNRSDDSSGYVRITVVDNGRGFDSDSVHLGFGLLGIRERAESLGGKFWLRTRPEQGVSISVEIPYGGAPRWQLP